MRLDSDAARDVVPGAAPRARTSARGGPHLHAVLVALTKVVDHKTVVFLQAYDGVHDKQKNLQLLISPTLKIHYKTLNAKSEVKIVIPVNFLTSRTAGPESF